MGRRCSPADQDISGITTNAEFFDPGLGFSNSWRPLIASATSPVSLGGTLLLLGSGFRGIAEGSGGTAQNSPADYPIVQLRSIESGQSAFLLSTNWSATTFNSTTVWGFPPGFGRHGVRQWNFQRQQHRQCQRSGPHRAVSDGLDQGGKGSIQFTFANTPGAVFGGLAATNLNLPLTNWTRVGGVTEAAPGQFQFLDSQATNYPQRFYVIRSF